MMTTTSASSTGIGLPSPWQQTKMIKNVGRHSQRLIRCPLQSSFPLRDIKMAGFVSEVEFKKDKGNPALPLRRNTNQRFQKMQCKAFSGLNHPLLPVADQIQIEAITVREPHFVDEVTNAASALKPELFLVDIDAATAKTLIGLLGPFLSGFGFLFILRIVMSWYPKLPVEKFPYVIAYAPTEPLLAPTRKLIPPLAGVDVTPVVWFGLLSFLNEILVGPQGLLVLLSQQL